VSAPVIERERLVAQLVALVDTYSPTYAEGPALELLEEMLDEARLPYFRQSMPEEDERYNLIASIGPEPVALMWVGHVDTVALYDEEQREVEVSEGRLWGLGAADMKGACVAAVEALRLLRDEHLPLTRGVRVALVVGEEEYGDGSSRLIEEFRAPLVIIGEPSSLVPCTSHYGYFEVALRAFGERAHAAVPEIGHNAIHGLLAYMQELFQAVGLEDWATRSAVTPRRIDGGSPLFAVPERCEAVLDVHLAPGLGVEALTRPLERAEERALAEHPFCRFEHEVLFSSPGHVAQDAPLLPEAFAAAGLPFAPAPFRSHSDAALFHGLGMNTIVCGPGALEVAHRPDENVALDELEQATRLYYELFKRAALGGP
jgi:acetylornithine deacetylase